MPTLRPILLPALCAAALLTAACGGGSADPDSPFSPAVQRFQESHQECSNHMFRVPCQIGPDGKLYKFNPGEYENR